MSGSRDTGAGRALFLALVTLALLCAVPALAAAKANPKRRPAKGASAAQTHQIAKLEALTRTLSQELAGLEGRAAALAAQASQPTLVPPSVLPFQGPAGGSLVGSFPNPGLAAGVVGSAQLQFDAVDGPAVRDGSLTGADLSPRSINAGQLTGATLQSRSLPEWTADSRLFGSAFETEGSVLTEGMRTLAPGHETGEIDVFCPNATGLLAGGFRWADENGDGTIVLESHPYEPTLDHEGSTDIWVLRAKVLRGGTTNTFEPQLLCLNH